VSILDIGPDGIILVEALIVSAAAALVAWRRVGFTTAAVLTLAAAMPLPIWQEAVAPSASHKLLLALFIIVPTGLLLGASRVGWIARHAWILIIAGPVMFVGCFVGICELCAKAGLLS
jgi:hypothetical protein